jgi:DNA invertase Pin-like site-specific DNA recombinase
MAGSAPNSRLNFLGVIMRYVAYLSAPMARQVRRLELEAQRKAVAEFVNERGVLIGEYAEVESGKRSDKRLELQAALAECVVRDATLIVPELGRLARNVAFTAPLLESGVPFAAADMPQANQFTLRALAAIAERDISKRIKVALGAAKARGAKLGYNAKNHGEATLNGLRAIGVGKPGWTAGAAGMRAKADQYAAMVLPTVKAMWAEGIVSQTSIARELNRRGIAAPRGGQWTATSVRNLLARDREGAASIDAPAKNRRFRRMLGVRAK